MILNTKTITNFLLVTQNYIYFWEVICQIYRLIYLIDWIFINAFNFNNRSSSCAKRMSLTPFLEQLVNPLRIPKSSESQIGLTSAELFPS